MATQWRRKSMAALTMLLALTMMLGIVAYLPRTAFGDDDTSLSQTDVWNSGAVLFAMGPRIYPEVATRVTAKMVNVGEPVFDEVTSVIADTSADGEWTEDIELLANGYYFDEIKAEKLDTAITPMDNESAADFLGRLADRGYTAVAYATASFTAPNQTVKAQAMTEMGGLSR